jgi:hypothetical protein
VNAMFSAEGRRCDLRSPLDNEVHKVSFEKTSTTIAAGYRKHSFRAFLDGAVVGEF